MIFDSIADIINQSAGEQIQSYGAMQLTFGKVKSITPIMISVNNTTILTKEHLVLTEGVIRKEFHIAVHTHLFEDGTFKHSHSDQNMLMYNTDWSMNFAPVPTQLGPQTINVIQGKIDLKNGQKMYDLSHDTETDFETLPNPEPTNSTVTVKINGEEFPLSKDPDGGSEEDVDGTEKYWAVLNYGLHVNDLVVMLRCPDKRTYVVLSKLYPVKDVKYREDK